MFFKKKFFLRTFEFQSGVLFKILRLKIERRKTDFFRLGVQNLSESFPHEFKLTVQIVGGHFDYDELSKPILKQS